MSNSQHDQGDPADVVPLAAVSRVVRQGWRLIAAATLVGAVVAFAFGQARASDGTRPTYRAEGLVTLEEQTMMYFIGPLPEPHLTARGGIGWQMQLMQSNETMSRAARLLGTTTADLRLRTEVIILAWPIDNRLYLTVTAKSSAGALHALHVLMQSLEETRAAHARRMVAGAHKRIAAELRGTSAPPPKVRASVVALRSLDRLLEVGAVVPDKPSEVHVVTVGGPKKTSGARYAAAGGFAGFALGLLVALVLALGRRRLPAEAA